MVFFLRRWLGTFVRLRDFDKKLFGNRLEIVENANPVNDKKLNRLC